MKPVRQTFPQGSHGIWKISRIKSLLASIAACLLLVFYIGFLLIKNFQSQTALHDASLNRFHIDLEKRAASLGYFFSERKYDLSTLSLSREINSYFTNSALGMSEQYGLKVNRFMIQQIFNKLLDERHLQGNKIYSRFVLFDNSGETLVDSMAAPGDPSPVARPLVPKSDDSLPYVHFIEEGNHSRLLISVTCAHRSIKVGEIIAWLAEETLFSHFVNLNDSSNQSGAGLVDYQGRFHNPYENNYQKIASNAILDRKTVLETAVFTRQYPVNGERQELLIANLPIPTLQLTYVAWLPVEQVVGNINPRSLIAGMVVVATVVLISLGLILWYFTENMILKTRFDETAKQQNLLSHKNQQLKEEIDKRVQAEKELEMQRTLHIRTDRLRSLGEMAAGIAHELNQPLVGVRGYAEIVIDTLDQGTEIPSDKLRGYTEMILQQVDRMVHIIDHVRLFARDAGKIVSSVVDLNKVVASGISLLTAQFNSRGLLLQCEYYPHPLPVEVNQFSIEEVIFNLLSNARYALEQRKAKESELFRPCIWISTRSEELDDKRQVVLTITDNGAGIPVDCVDKVFDPFFTTKEPDQGTGLGLSICKSIVESFNGHIQFVTEHNMGTTFKITFPPSHIKVVQ